MGSPAPWELPPRSTPAAACARAGLLHRNQTLLKLGKYFEGVVDFYPLGSRMSYQPVEIHPLSHTLLRSISDRGWQEMSHAWISCSPPAPHLVSTWTTRGGGEGLYFCKVRAMPLTMGAEHLLQAAGGPCARTQPVLRLKAPPGTPTCEHVASPELGAGNTA